MSDQEKMQRRIKDMRNRLKEVPPTTQLVNLFGALWRDAEDDVTVLMDQVIFLRRALRPFIHDLDKEKVNPMVRTMLERAKTAYDDSNFVEEWKNLK